MFIQERLTLIRNIVQLISDSVPRHSITNYRFYKFNYLLTQLKLIIMCHHVQLGPIMYSGVNLKKVTHGGTGC